MPIKQEVVDQLTGEWKIGLCTAPVMAPHWFCCGCFCSCCLASTQRHEILDIINEPYVCCGGIFPCGPLGAPRDRNCVWLEACCCTGYAIAGNRFLIQTRFDRQNTCCDDCILWTACLAPWIICCLECGGVDVPDEIESCVDCLQCIVSGCMLAQQEVEVKHIKKTGWSGPNPAISQMLPPGQQKMMQHAAAAGAVFGGAAGAGAAMGAAGRQKPAQYGHPVHRKDRE